MILLTNTRALGSALYCTALYQSLCAVLAQVVEGEWHAGHGGLEHGQIAANQI